MTALHIVVAAGLLAVSQLVIATLLDPGRAVRPLAGIVMWMSILTLRAVFMITSALLLMAFGISGSLPSWLPAWCIHLTSPLDQSHLGLSDHAAGEIAKLLPVALVLGSFLLAGYGIWKAGREVRKWIGVNAVGEGPTGSLIVNDPEMLIAAAGVRRPVVVVSPGALMELDESELAASLQHEWGHVRRRHRIVTLSAELLLSLSRPLPGGSSALANLRYFLERDADEYAVGKTGDPASLVRAICKVANATFSPRGPAVASLGGAGVPARLRMLVDRQRPSRRSDWLALGATFAVATLVVAVVATNTVIPLLENGFSIPHVALARPTCL